MIEDRWSFNGIKIIEVYNDIISLKLVPELGGLIWAIYDRTRSVSVLGSVKELRSLSYFDGLIKNKDFLDILFVGGWYEIIPNPGYYNEYGGASYGLHEETPYLPWTIYYGNRQDDKVSMRVDLIKVPLSIQKEIKIDKNIITVNEKIRNNSDEPIRFGWLHHPFFGEEVINRGTSLKLPPCDINVDPNADKNKSILKPNFRGKWPLCETLSGGYTDLSKLINKGEENLEDLVYISNLSRGEAVFQNPVKGFEYKMIWDPAIFKYLWLWRAFGGGSGYPWYGNIHGLGLELASGYPSGISEQLKSDRAITLEGDREIKTEIKLFIN